jgi:hypothetical protein
LEQALIASDLTEPDNRIADKPPVLGWLVQNAGTVGRYAARMGALAASIRQLGHDLHQFVAELEQQGVAFESLTEKIETSSAAGKLVFHVFAALAEFERNLIRERTHAGLAAARARGRKGGRKPALTPQQVREIKALLRDPSIPVASIADRYGVSRATIYKHAGADAPARHQSGPSSGPAKGANRV